MVKSCYKISYTYKLTKIEIVFEFTAEDLTGEIAHK